MWGCVDIFWNSPLHFKHKNNVTIILKLLYRTIWGLLLFVFHLATKLLGEGYSQLEYIYCGLIDLYRSTGKLTYVIKLYGTPKQSQETVKILHHCQLFYSTNSSITTEPDCNVE